MLLSTDILVYNNQYDCSGQYPFPYEVEIIIFHARSNPRVSDLALNIITERLNQQEKVDIRSYKRPDFNFKSLFICIIITIVFAGDSGVEGLGFDRLVV